MGESWLTQYQNPACVRFYWSDCTSRYYHSDLARQESRTDERALQSWLTRAAEADKDCLDVLKSKGLRKRGGPSIGSGDIRARRERAAGAGTQLDDETTEDLRQERGAGTKAGIGASTGAGTRAGTREGIRAGTRVSTRAHTERGDKRKEDLGRGDERDPTGVRNFASRSFLLAARLFFFFTTSSSESVTT